MHCFTPMADIFRYQKGRKSFYFNPRQILYNSVEETGKNGMSPPIEPDKIMEYQSRRKKVLRNTHFRPFKIGRMKMFNVYLKRCVRTGLALQN